MKKKTASKFDKSIHPRTSLFNKKLEEISTFISSNPDKALTLASQLVKEDESNPHLWLLIAKVYHKLGKFLAAENSVNNALDITPNSNEAILTKVDILYASDRYEEASEVLSQASPLFDKKNLHTLLGYKASVFIKQKKYQLAIDIYQELIATQPTNWRHWNNLGMIYLDLGRFSEMDNAYRISSELSGEIKIPFYNRIVGAHYNPTSTAEKIIELCKEWQNASKFKKGLKVNGRVKKNKTLRIGMISDGFRTHPVGNMITLGLSYIAESDMEFYAYSTNFVNDHVTQRIKGFCSKWQVIENISDLRVSKIIRDDEIDILFDLCGYNSNSRMAVFQLKPAPIQVKWVGGLISSTCLETMDYLLSDKIETPQGVDALYTEKLIRLPDDYICYEPPFYLPALKDSPVKTKGYITFGCFNNASKINDTVLYYWSGILHKVQDSRLYIKSFNFDDKSLCENVLNRLEALGIARDRVRIEGSSTHEQLLSCYNDIDIALDPWPYSGGLTTCEAMAMGVPVVTYPGPTFAGRHSATHLVNAGMPELVAESWEQYISIAVGLANDDASLNIIRKHLREILLASPVCNGIKFGQHFSDAMRAIWQRYCENKQPEALTLNNDAPPYFHDDMLPVELHRPTSNKVSREFKEHNSEFHFLLKGRVTLVDYGARIARGTKLAFLNSLNAFSFIIMDINGDVNENELPVRKEAIHHIKLHAFSNGDAVSINFCLDPMLTSDLKPITRPNERQIVTSLQAQRSQLDDFFGSKRVDWFILDNRFDLLAVFSFGKNILNSCLILDIKISFNPTHEGQMSFDEIKCLLKSYGFVMHSLRNIEYRTVHIDSSESDSSHKEIKFADALFIPEQSHFEMMSEQQREKLAFILHVGYQITDTSYALLLMNSVERADEFMAVVKQKEMLSDQEVVKKETVSLIPDMPRMSIAERNLFEQYVKKAIAYYEFGSGGSTKLATRNSIDVYGVESDKRWVDTLKKEIGPKCKVEYVDIGPTREWGYPVSTQYKEKFPLYSQSILKFENAFDFILIDGRFRVACTLCAIQHTLEKQADIESVYIFIHDFWDRPDYHVVLEFLDVHEVAETAGVFRLKKDIDRVLLTAKILEYKFVAI